MDKKLKIFFTASYYGKQIYQKYYDLVLAKIEESEVEVIGTEKGNYMELLGISSEKSIFSNKALHYKAVKKGILWCDAAIIEISHEDFQLGHEATLASQLKRPVLCLSIHEDFSKKIKNKYFHGVKYNEYNVGQVIRNFLTEIRRERFSERFNCFLSKKQVAYLEKISKEDNMNKSEYLRSLLEDDMRK